MLEFRKRTRKDFKILKDQNHREDVSLGGNVRKVVFWVLILLILLWLADTYLW